MSNISIMSTRAGWGRDRAMLMIDFCYNWHPIDISDPVPCPCSSPHPLPYISAGAPSFQNHWLRNESTTLQGRPKWGRHRGLCHMALITPARRLRTRPTHEWLCWRCHGILGGRRARFRRPVLRHYAGSWRSGTGLFWRCPWRPQRSTARPDQY